MERTPTSAPDGDEGQAGDWISELFTPHYTVMDDGILGEGGQEDRAMRRITPLDPERMEKVYERALAYMAADREERRRREVAELKRRRRQRKIAIQGSPAEQPSPPPASAVTSGPEAEVTGDGGGDLDLLEADDIIWSQEELESLRDTFRQIKKENVELRVAHDMAQSRAEEACRKYKQLRLKFVESERAKEASHQANVRHEINVRDLEYQVADFGFQLSTAAEQLGKLRDERAEWKVSSAQDRKRAVKLEHEAALLRDGKQAREAYWRGRISREVEAARIKCAEEQRGLEVEMEELWEQLEQEKKARARDGIALDQLRRHFSSQPLVRGLGGHAVTKIDYLSPS